MIKSISMASRCLLLVTVLFAKLALADTSAFNAIEQGDVKALQTWLKVNPEKVDMSDSQGNTLLLQAGQQKKLAMVKMLLNAGANVNALNHQKRDILNTAVSNRSVELVILALANGADPTLVTSVYEGSALIYATHQGQVEIVKLLIEAGAPLNRVNNLGWTALLEATILGDGGVAHQRIVTMLLAGGGDANIADREGRTPLDHARSKGHLKMTKLLEPVTH